METPNKYEWKYDHINNTGYLRLTYYTPVDRTLELTKGLMLDVAKDGTPIGVEYLGEDFDEDLFRKSSWYKAEKMMIEEACKNTNPPENGNKMVDEAMTPDKVEEIAMNIVYQLDDDSGASVEFRQKNNDKRIDFVAKLLTQHHQDLMSEVVEKLLEKIENTVKHTDNIEMKTFLYTDQIKPIIKSK